jgi:hypothetical protein
MIVAGGGNPANGGLTAKARRSSAEEKRYFCENPTPRNIREGWVVDNQDLVLPPGRALASAMVLEMHVLSGEVVGASAPVSEVIESFNNQRA